MGFDLLIVLFARVASISSYSTDVPFWDQWGAEGAGLIGPWLDGSLTLASLFSAHNEHRIFFTRIISLALFELNERQWDNHVSAIFNAGLWGATLATLATYLRARLSAGLGVLVCVLVVALGTSPFGWENLVCGFQSQFYLASAFTFLAIFTASSCMGELKQAIGLTVVCLAALVTMGSGLFAAVCALAVLALRRHAGILTKPAFIRSAVPLIACVVLGVSVMVKAPQHDVLKSQGVGELVRSATLVLSWPSTQRFPGLLMWIPVVLLFAVAVFNPRRLSSLDYGVIGLGLWVGLQGFAIAYARGHELQAVASRYSDVVAFGGLAAVLAAFRIWELMRELGRGRFRTLIVAALFIGVVFGVVQQGVEGMVGIRERGVLYEIQADNVRAYVRLGLKESIYNKPHLHIPYPDAAYLQVQLDNPNLVASLPASVRRPLVLVTPELDGFVPGGSSPKTPSPAAAGFLGSYEPSQEGAAQGSFSTAPTQTHFRHVLVRTAGFLGRPGLRLEYTPAGPEPKRHHSLVPATPPGEGWSQHALVVPPEGLVFSGYDHDPESWFAFTAPVEVGRLTLWASRLFGIWQTWLWGSAFFLLALLTMAAIRSTQIEKSSRSLVKLGL